MSARPRPDAGWSPTPPLGGRPTNATLLRRGTRAVAPTTGRPPTRLDYWPTALRVVALWCAAAAGLGLVWLWSHGHRPGVERFVLACGMAGAGMAGWRLVGLVVGWRHEHEVVRPLHAALHSYAGRHELETPGRYLDVPRNYAVPGGPPVVMHFHPGWRDLGVDVDGVGGERRAVEDVFRSKLGDVTCEWHTRGGRPHVLARAAQPPPQLVAFTDPAIGAAVARLDRNRVLLGLGSKGAHMTVELLTEIPHLAISAATGAGKSVMLRSIAAQLAHKGWAVRILDVKRVSHEWADGVPGVAVIRDDEAVHHELLWLWAEIERRTRGGSGPPIAVMFDELNLTVGQLNLWWEEHRDGGRRRQSPAVLALHRALLAGRQLGITIVVASQSLTVRALGGDPAIREQFIARVIGGAHSSQLWDMLAGDLPRVPQTDQAGRMYVVAGGRARAIQTLLMDDDEARAWATAGETAEPVTPETAGEPTPVTVTDRPRLTVVPEPEPERVTLAEAARQGVVPMTAVTLRQAKHRALRRGDPFPQSRREGNAETYDIDELRAWHTARRSTIGGET